MKLHFLILLLFLANSVTAQSNKEKFNQLLRDKDTTGQRELLEKWEASNSEDPELVVAWFNYYVTKSKKELLTIGDNPKGEEALKMMDSTKETIGYIYGTTYYEPTLINKGFEKIRDGIRRFPDRLDLRFGYIYVLGEVGDYQTFSDVIIETIKHSKKNKNKWKWMDDEPVKQPEEFMLASIQDYQVMLYNTDNKELLNNMKRIAEEILAVYPKHIESMSNLSIVEMQQENFDAAITVLKKAIKINSKDVILLNNIAYAYSLKGDKENAIHYYEEVIKYGDKNDQFLAREEIMYLKK